MHPNSQKATSRGRRIGPQNILKIIPQFFGDCLRLLLRTHRAA